VSRRRRKKRRGGLNAEFAEETQRALRRGGFNHRGHREHRVYAEKTGGRSSQ